MPDSDSSINLAFQLRRVLGVGIRAEAIRVLVTVDAPWVTAMTISHMTAYSKRNVHEMLANLTASGAVTALTVNNEQRYSTDRESWATLLGGAAASSPVHREWRQLLGALRRILRWLAQEGESGGSEYLRSSRIRDLLETLDPDLAFAGVPVQMSGSPESIPLVLEEVIERCLAQLKR
ncbi:MAG: hypothetical protein ACRDK4_02625 [Solirubrobacteraceae bacterium]